MPQALAGIRVLDLSRLLPGPYCSMILADLGAEVLRIEDKRFAAEGPGMPTVMRNKRHMTLNLKNPRGQEIFYSLAQRADVILEGFRPGVAARLGIDYPRLKKINESIIYCSLSGYGQDGPYKDMVGHDINYLSFAGILSLNREMGRKPVIPPIQIADIAAGGMFAALGIMAALIYRQKSGQGQYIDIAMLDGLIAMLPFLATLCWESTEELKGITTLLSGRFPCYNIYETKDGQYISIGALEHRFWVNLCRKLGREDFIPYQFASGEKREEIFRFLQNTFQQKTREEWMMELRDVDVCLGKVLSLDEALNDPQVKHRKMVVEFLDSQKGRQRYLASPIKLSATPPSIWQAAAEFGEHTEEVLRELGLGQAEIKKLKEEGVV
ncbi:MAG: CaiB/BaiF CoA transferase family protein [Thermodesulfobacteriota bacterium]